MKKENEFLINPEFSDLFEFKTEEEELTSDARMLSFSFLSEVERVYGKGRGLKTTLAEGTGLSKSYFSQIFNGDKLVNYYTLAKIQKLFGIKFKIKAYPVEPSEQEIIPQDQVKNRHFKGSFESDNVALNDFEETDYAQICTNMESLVQHGGRAIAKINEPEKEYS